MKRVLLIIPGLFIVALVWGLALTATANGATTGESAVVVSAEDEKPEAKKAEAKADEKAKKPAVKPSDKKGKYYFKKGCKSCHGKDGDGGEVTPISKTIKQWERYFRKAVHTEELPFDSLGTEEELIHIGTFLVNHAADSDQPETCGR